MPGRRILAEGPLAFTPARVTLAVPAACCEPSGDHSRVDARSARLTGRARIHRRLGIARSREVQRLATPGPLPRLTRSGGCRSPRQPQRRGPAAAAAIPAVRADHVALASGAPHDSPGPASPPVTRDVQLGLAPIAATIRRRSWWQQGASLGPITLLPPHELTETRPGSTQGRPPKSRALRHLSVPSATCHSTPTAAHATSPGGPLHESSLSTSSRETAPHFAAPSPPPSGSGRGSSRHLAFHTPHASGPLVKAWASLPVHTRPLRLGS